MNRLTGCGGKSSLTLPNKARNSNVEWLRIISMLQIIAFHAAEVGYNSTDANIIAYASGQVFGSWGILGVDLFFFISVWFLVDQKFHVKRVISIVFETFTWVFAYTLLSILYDFQKTQSIRAIISNFCIGSLNALAQPFWADYYWFVTTYVFILMLSPLLNKIVNAASQSNLKKFC